MTWDPAQYNRFARFRARPFRDLLARVANDGPAPARVADLGCGTGARTQLLAARWPDAQVVGVDSSAEMLARSAPIPGRLRFERADLRTWSPAAPLDLLFSNAALHWLDDHASLIPALVEHLAPGGVMAAQLPYN